MERSGTGTHQGCGAEGQEKDMADLYKHLTSIPAAFVAVRQDPNDDGELVRKLLKERVEEERIMQRMPKDLAALFETAEAAPAQAGDRPVSALP